MTGKTLQLVLIDETMRPQDDTTTPMPQDALNPQPIVFEGIEEYVCGFAYFYIRFWDGQTTSINRKQIHQALRKLPTGDYRAIHLKKAKVYLPRAEHDEDEMRETSEEEQQV